MRLLVLGGTVFLSKAVAVEAVARGHEVVCACRGESGTVPDGARLVRWDRGAGDPAPTAGIGEVDAVVDVARHPSWVRAGVAAYPQAHWVFVSTINVYPDDATPGLTPATSTLAEPVLTDEDLASDPGMYGAMKVGCEQLVREGAASSMLVRPGLIAGPGDPSGRFTYWPERLSGAVSGQEVLAGGDPTDLVQVIDVRDLAAWLVTSAERRTTGAYDATSHAVPIGDLLAEVASGVGSDATLTWVPSTFLEEHGVEPWSGGSGLPLWLPRPDHDGMMRRDVTPSYAAGLTTRPVADTARDTLAWLREQTDAPRTGLTREHEETVLAAWAARS